MKPRAGPVNVTEPDQSIVLQPCNVILITEGVSAVGARRVVIIERHSLYLDILGQYLGSYTWDTQFQFSDIQLLSSPIDRLEVQQKMTEQLNTKKREK